MSDYTKTVDFAAKDSLPSGNSGKIIKGTEFETEFDNIATAIATKANLAGPTFTGVLTFASFKGATGATVTTILDEDDMATNSATALATQQSIKAYVDAQQDTVDTLAEILALSNTTGGTDLAVSTGDDITFADSSKAIFGSATDLAIYSDGTNSYIQEGSGTSGIRITTDNQLLIRKHDDETIAAFNVDGAVRLYHDTSEKIATTATGIDVTGTATMDGLTVEADSNALIRISDSTNINQRLDLQHNGGVASLISGNNGAYGTIKLQSYNGTDTVDRMAINAIGNVGIGESNPSNKLHVTQNVDAVLAIEVDNQNTGASSAAGLYLNGQGNNFYLKNYGDGTSNANITEFVSTAAGSQFVFATASQEAMRISSGNLMVGVTSTTLTGGSLTLPNSGIIAFHDAGGNARNVLQFVSGDIKHGAAGGGVTTQSFYTNNTLRATIDSSGSVGIGSSSPAAKLDVVRTGAGIQDTLQLRNEQTLASGVGSSLGFGDSGGARLAYIAGAAAGANNDNGYLSFYTRASDSLAERMRIDASGHVGIGSTAPDKLLVVQGASAEVVISDSSNSPLLRFRESGVTKGTIGTSSGDLIFHAGGDTERMRIDASGNLLVATTSIITTTDTSGSGHDLRNTGVVLHKRDGGTVQYLNRLTSDGDMVDFSKDGTTVGAIGTRASYLNIGSGDTGLLFNSAQDRIQPESTTGGSRDAAIDIGGSATRFKDLYLSGGAHLGGTTAANKLDDYETGTFTPTVAGDATGVFGAAEGYYTKVGRLVFIELYFTVGTNFTSNTVGGLPFTVANLATGTSYGQSAVVLTSAADTVTGAAQEATTNATFYNDHNILSAHAPNTTNSAYRLSMCYQST